MKRPMKRVLRTLRKHFPWKPLAGLVVAAAILLLFYHSHEGFKQWADHAIAVFASGDRERVTEWISELGWIGPVAIVAFMTLQLFLAVIPSFLLIIVAILAYGALPGGALAMLATLVAAAFAYAIGYAFGANLTIKLAGKRSADKISKELDAYGPWAVIIARISPFLSNDLISLAAGILRMSFWKFMLATAIGIAPLIALIAFNKDDIDSLKQALLWATALGLAGLAAKIYLDHRGRARAAEETAP